MIPAKVVTDTGKNAYRNPEAEPYPDGRPTIFWPHPFWESEDERKRYERAALEIPRRKHLSMPLEKYLSEVVVLATGLAPRSVKSMPKVEVY